MTNPFEEIIARLDRIESMFAQVLQSPEELQKKEKPLTQLEACEFLGKSRVTIINWTKKGIIKSYKLGGRVYYKKWELISDLSKLRE